jgi:hypothetical protein
VPLIMEEGTRPGEDQTQEHQVLIDTMEHKVGPRNGARVVARAWMDPAYKKLLLENAPRFKVRQRVRARNIDPTGHTRLPRYVRDKTGVIVRDHGVYLFPDTNAHFQGEKRQHVYSVRFAARELWGEIASPRDSVHLDLWDDYLDRD